MKRRTTSEFVELCNKTHNGKYNYDKTVYTNKREKVTITCPIHGDFEQTANSHLRGCGCPKCGNNSSVEKRTTKLDDFILKSNTIHNNKYDYSKVEYVNANTKVCIICPEHGEFWQKPSHHLNGVCCPMCTNENKKHLLDAKKTFIEKAIKIHGYKYDYSKVIYNGSKEKIRIICPEHGEFWQTPNSHLNGRGCPECAKMKIASIRQKDTTSFVKDAIEKHEHKYDYSKVEYVNSQTKVCIICPKHGEFWQTPANHLQGVGCSKCGHSNSKMNNRKTNELFIKDAIKTHGNKYNYSNVNYINAFNKVCIKCPEHGEFWQTPNMHLYGQGCPKCCGNVKHTTNDFIEKAKIVHENKYDYSKVDYVNNQTKVCIICPEHGEFWQTPSEHLRGKGCQKCGGTLKSTTKEFIEKSHIIHQSKYDYSKCEYVNNRTKLLIICPIHGEFYQSPDKHLQGQGCPKCSNQVSGPENKIIDLLKELKPLQRDREVLNGKEIDIYIPSLKLGIEYNGLRWHSEKFGKDRHYHIDKLSECNKNGIRLIQIFEDEWINHREICESKIKQICGLNNNPKIFARKCSVREIDGTIAKKFLDTNHIQSYAKSTAYLGCYTIDNQLIGVMTFKKEKDGYCDLNRFATDINYQCIGVGGKLFKYFIQNYDFKEIKSFADRRWTTNPTDNLYTKLGFEFVEFTKPDYRYFKENTIERFHKFGFRKQRLNKKYGLPLTMTESEMVNELGYDRIWDCGLIKYVYKKEDIN